MKRISIILSVIFVVSMVGCGYTTSSSLPPRMKTIHVESFKNAINLSAVNPDAYFPFLEVKVHDAVIDRFLFNGSLRVVEAENADLILKGELVEYQRNPLRYLDNDDVEEQRVQIVMKLQLVDVSQDEIMWEYDRFIGEATYFLTGSQASTEDSAVEEATEDIARRIVETTVENW